MPFRTTSHFRRVLFSLPLLLMLLACLAPPAVAGAAPGSANAVSEHLVHNIFFSHSSPNVLALGQDLTFTFDYKTSHAAGVRIWLRPFTDGNLTPNYSGHGSPVHPAGVGSASGSFAVHAAAATVDQVRIEMWAEDGSALLFRAFLPVHYEFHPPANLVRNVTLTRHTPNVLALGETVDVSFDYIATDPGGVRIFPRPFTGGALTPNYAASPSPLYPPGTGAGSGFFSISDNPSVVDEIRIQVYNSDQSVLLFEVFLPVHYDYRAFPNVVTRFNLHPPSPNILEFDQTVNVDFTYQTNEPGGVRIYVRPVSRGSLTPNYAAHGSPLHPIGSGTSTGFFSITTRVNVVDRIRIDMWNDDQTALLFRAELPVHYQYGALYRSFLPLTLR
jgi:hypothetical protein